MVLVLAKLKSKRNLVDPGAADLCYLCRHIHNEINRRLDAFMNPECLASLLNQ